MKKIAIVAMDEGRVIGVDGHLPWDISEDKKRFKELTRGHTVFMGRKSYDAPDMPKPLPGRHNVVCTRSPEKIEPHKSVTVCTDPEAFLRDLSKHESELRGDIFWVIGGEDIYRMSLPFLDEINLTYVYGKHPGDTFFPEFENDFELTEEEKYDTHAYRRYVRK